MNVLLINMYPFGVHVRFRVLILGTVNIRVGIHDFDSDARVTFPLVWTIGLISLRYQ